VGEICLVLRTISKAPGSAARASAARVVRPVAASPRSPRGEPGTPYSDAKVANRDTKVWHGATEKGP
jgi:hypothetical protein